MSLSFFGVEVGQKFIFLTASIRTFVASTSLQSNQIQNRISLLFRLNRITQLSMQIISFLRNHKGEKKSTWFINTANIGANIAPRPNQHRYASSERRVVLEAFEDQVKDQPIELLQWLQTQLMNGSLLSLKQMLMLGNCKYGMMHSLKTSKRSRVLITA